MNYWTGLSIDYANQKNYLDDLFKVYPTIPEGIRDIDEIMWKNIENAFNEKNNIALLENLLKCNLFPIKDSYIAYLKEIKQRFIGIRQPFRAFAEGYMRWDYPIFILVVPNQKKPIGKLGRFSVDGLIKEV